MKQIQEWLGHSTFSTTADTYSHLEYNSKIGSAEKIGKALDFSGGTETESEDNNLIQKFMQEHGLNNAAELMAFIAKYTENETEKQKKCGSEM